MNSVERLVKMDKDTADTEYNNFEDCARQYYASIVWIHKIQEKQADIYSGWFFWIKCLGVVFSAAVSICLIVLFYFDVSILKFATTIVSFCVTACSTILRFCNFESIIKDHRNSAAEIQRFRDRYLLVLMDAHLKSGSSAEFGANEIFREESINNSAAY